MEGAQTTALNSINEALLNWDLSIIINSNSFVRHRVKFDVQSNAVFMAPKNLILIVQCSPGGHSNPGAAAVETVIVRSRSAAIPLSNRIPIIVIFDQCSGGS